MRVKSTGWKLCVNCHGVINNGPAADDLHAMRMVWWEALNPGEAWQAVCAPAEMPWEHWRQCDGCGLADHGARHVYSIIGL